MIYRVLMNGQDIFNPQERQYALIEPHLSMELNTAGSFEFTMHPSHPFYDDIKPFTSLVEVYEDEVLLWFGRPVEISTDFYNQKRAYCEGAFAFFNDSVQRPAEYNSISIRTFFRTLVSNHNAQVNSNRQFTVGTITIEDKNVYRKLDYDNTFDCLKRQCLNAEGGYFFFRRENGVNYIDWLVEMPYSTNQPVEFGLNMLNASTQFDMTEFCTCVLPLGEEVDGVRLTVASINDGSDVLESEAIAEYGKITKCVEFSGVTHVETLYEDGLEYLQSKQFDNLTIECTAAELHWQNENYTLFRLGQKVHAYSVPHIIDKTFDLLRLDISLDTAQKQITLGTYRRPTLTEITKDNASSQIDNDTAIGGIDSKIDEIITTIDDITNVPSPDDIINEIHDNLDNINDLLNDDGFTNHIQDMLDNNDLDHWLIDHGVDEVDLGDVTPEYVVELINADLGDITEGLDDSTDYSYIGSINESLDEYWIGNEDIFEYDNSNYEDISSYISYTSSLIDTSSNSDSFNTVLTDLRTQMNELVKKVNSLEKYALPSWGKDIEKRLGNVEELARAVAIDAWVHLVDGRRVEVATVNFVTKD